MDQQSIISHGQAAALGSKAGSKLARCLGAGSRKQALAGRAGALVGRIAGKKAAKAVTKIAGMKKGGRVTRRGPDGRFLKS